MGPCGALRVRRDNGGAAMNCPDPETLRLYQAGMLPVEEAEAVRRHLIDCPACAALAAVPAPAPLDEPEVAAPAFLSAAEMPAAGPAASPLTEAIAPRPGWPGREELRGYL